MFPRRNSTAYSSKRLRRAKSTASTVASSTKSEMLNPHEKQKQAIAAAQHAFGSDQARKSREIRLRQSSPNLRPPLTELAVNRRPSVRFSSFAQTTDDGSSVYGDSTAGEDYETTIVRRRSMHPSYRYEDSSPEPISSTPSSFRRMTRSRSAVNLTVGELDASPVVFAAERSPQRREMGRKSASFLRGGTEFMPESLRKREERKSFYLPSNQRPMFIPENYKGKNEKGEWGAIRLSMKKKARKISETVFEGVKSLFGKGQKEEKQTMPEQQITASRMHFRDYVAPDELDIDPPTLSSNTPGVVKTKIRSNFVVSKAPTLHFVPSSEMIVSDVASIHDHYSTPARSSRRVSPVSTGMGTWTTTTSTNWNSTIASRKTVRPDRLDNIYEGLRSDTPVNGLVPRLYIPPQRKERYNVDVRRLYSAIVKKMENTQPGPGYCMPPGIGLLPEEEGLFERHSSATTSRSGSFKGTIRGKIRIQKRASSSTIDSEPPTRDPPPVPEIPKMWLDADMPPSREPPGPPQRPMSVDPATSTDAALSACHLQVLKTQNQRRSSPVSSSIPSTTHTPAPFFIAPEMLDTPRSRSAVGFRRAEASTPIPRGTTAIGLRVRNINVLKEEERKVRRRQSRASMREFDVESAVRAQFGDVWDGEGRAFL